MAKNEDGEFELILGNRQLLSVFFIVVILLGVFFTMGYIVGRNSTPVAADIASRQESKPPVPDSPPRQPEPAPASPTPAPKPKEAEKPAPPEPVRPEKKEEPVKAEKAKPPKPEPPPPATPPPTAPPATAEPTSGQTYLQLAATSKREADIMLDLLKQKNFKAIAAEIAAKPGTFRVLVGPLSNDGVNKTRADLQGAGFPGDAAIKRTF